MENLKQNLCMLALCSLLTVPQAFAEFDTGLGNNLGGAVINNATDGLVGVDLGTNSASLNFNQSTQVNWNTLNLNANETLNFNAVDGASNLTVVNTVNNGMSNIFGQINANSGISKLIISNPNGVLFDGAKFTTAGDTLITTDNMYLNTDTGLTDIKEKTRNIGGSITITSNTEFRTGGDLVFVADTIDAFQSAFRGKSVKLSTTDGATFYLYTRYPKPGECILPHKPVQREKYINIDSISVTGDTLISSVASANIQNLETNGNLDVKTGLDTVIQEKLTVTGDTNITYDRDIIFEGLNEQEKTLLNENADLGGTLTVNGALINVIKNQTDNSNANIEDNDNARLLNKSLFEDYLNTAEQNPATAYAHDFDDEIPDIMRVRKNIDGSVTVLYVK